MHHSKICFKCNLSKPLNLFYKHEQMADGHLNKCIDCTKKDSLNHRDNNLEKVRAYDRERSKRPERIKQALIVTKNWRKSDKRIMHCHNAVARAIRSGLLEVKPCIVCGSLKSLAHHESYNRPLDVVFYCQAHHKQRHKEMVLQGIDPYEIETELATIPSR